MDDESNRDDATANNDEVTASSDDATAPTLVMYCRPWCGHCAQARMWLGERGIDYVEIDVDSDMEARERAAAFNEGRLHTPTFECGTEICVDFRPNRLCEILGIEP